MPRSWSSGKRGSTPRSWPADWPRRAIRMRRAPSSSVSTASFDYAAMRLASHAVAMGARLVATNDDRTFPSAGPDVPGAGAILASIEAASGVRALVCGKPHPPMIQALAPLLPPGPTWMVGDRLETDIAFARAAGYHGILVLTGVPHRTVDRGPHVPDLVTRLGGRTSRSARPLDSVAQAGQPIRCSSGWRSERRYRAPKTNPATCASQAIPDSPGERNWLRNQMPRKATAGIATTRMKISVSTRWRGKSTR